MRSSGRRRAVLASALALAGAALPAHAYEPVLHEFVPPDPREDVALAVTTVEGDLPAAIDTRSGLVAAPDTQRPPVSSDRAYTGGAPRGSEASYRPDRDTRRPDVVGYDDPFTPSVSPYKRLRAFDAVQADFTLKVRSPALVRIPVGGQASAADDEFYGDITVDLEPGDPTRIPSVAPGARVLRVHATPDVPVELLRDGAENWFAQGPRRGRVRLVLYLAAPRASFSGEVADVAWSELRLAGELPPNVARSARAAAEAIGVSRDLSPREAVRKLVAHFRSFAPSDEPPGGGPDILADLALSRRGVCRHRSFAFVPIALALGIPARMVVNEAHAWVEAHDGRLWHRIDLGGAARWLNDPHPGGVAHQPPNDPFPWPGGDASSGQRVAEAARRDHAAGAGSAAAGSTPGAPAGLASAATDDPRPPARITLAAPDQTVLHGAAVRVAGAVEMQGAACAGVRVDVALAPPTGSPLRLGSLVTDGRGRYDGAVIVPPDVPVGDYDLGVSTPGDARCGSGRGP